VLTNLIGNAIKFTAQGEVVVRVEKEWQHENAVGLHFSVSDTGIGIPDDKHRTIFEPFAQADGSTTRQYGGTGLGLAISSRLVSLMGGRLRVESAVGKGSTFHFTAVLGLPRTTVTIVSPAPVGRLRNLKVLVVDDNRTNQRFLAESLSSWQMKPVTADDANQALALLEQAERDGERYAMVLLDSQMPEIDGFTLAGKIKGNPKFANTPMIMLTSSGMRGDGVRCRQLGIGGYLSKPINQEELLDTVLLILGTPSHGSGPAPLVTRHHISENRHALRVLLAEDNVVNQKLIERLLQKLGHRVFVAGNGSEALDALEQQKFDLMLMDVQMPVLDGFQTTAIIREREKASGGHLHIIAVTAHAMKGDGEKCLTAGMDGYISKPIQVAELVKALEVLSPVGSAGGD